MNAINYVTSETETENRFWPYPKPKNRFYRTNPVLETLFKMIENGADHNYTTYYWSAVVTIAPYCTVFELFYAEYYHHLEI